MNQQGPAKQLARFSTGIPALDETMGGGLPVHSVLVIAGEPGTGKTVLALQMLFTAARAGKRCLYFTTLSEPSIKLMRYMQLFDFFDAEVLDRSIGIYDLGSTLRSDDPAAALAEFAEQVEEREPDLVIVDSFRAIHDLIPDPQRLRTLTYDLAVQMAGWGATTLLVGEYTPDELSRCPEFAVADGILRLGLSRRELAQVRELEIRKLRGSNFVSGVHFFDITRSGIKFYPRVRGPDDEGTALAHPMQRLSCGVAGIDELLDGGVPEASTSLVLGGTGTGKTLLGLHFVVDGARRGEAVVFFSLEETIEQLRTIGDSFGFDVTGLERRGLIHFGYTPPVELSTDRYLNDARELTERVRAKRVVIDSLTSLALGTASDRRYKELVYAITKHFRRQGITQLVTMETNELLGVAQLSGQGLSFAADNIIQLRYVELGGRLDRAISVIKARGVNLSTELRSFSIGKEGIKVEQGANFRKLKGVLTGLPSPE